MCACMSVSVGVSVWVCVCNPLFAEGPPKSKFQGVPGLLLMLGPTKTMSSRRENVPA